MRKKSNPKRRGEAAEAAFLARATVLGFSICVPWGESERYDCAIDSQPGFLRVQVKSATACSRSRYVVKGGGNGQPYTAEEIDFLAAYVVLRNLWYVIPVEAFAPRAMLQFTPDDSSRDTFGKYREAWCLLDCARKARGWLDIPVRCRSRELGSRCAVCPMRG
ncbi:MAG TPA: group I intron-associated PD-(D/E)XK endonuclease [Candidatus Eremiobacteraceae bacterium]|nr:group I intron-associated PD-(D/E)XK endonuclease [Candidatus Eremiobacteraceae bacterium]